MSRTIDPLEFPATLSRAAVSALPVYQVPPTYRLGSPGMGCFGDPPGFPTYYLRPVYNKHGNTPRNAPEAVIMGPDGKYRRLDRRWHNIQNEDGTFDYEASCRASDRWWEDHIRSLYNPLPVEHPRVQAWIASTGKHFAHCYADVERPEYGRPGTLIYPVPAYKLRTFRDDPRWSDAYRAAARAEVEAHNAQEIERATRIATVDNHRGVQIIREMYPDWSPPAGWVDGEIGPRPGDWWETGDKQPSPEDCPGMRGKYGAGWSTHQESMSRGGWCQFCGATTT